MGGLRHAAHATLSVVMGATLKIEWTRDCFATPAEWKLKRYALKLLWCFALKFGYGL